MEIYSIITFNSTHHAIAAEKLLTESGFHIRMIPVPTEVTSNCGLSIRFEPSDYKDIAPLLQHLDDISFYHVTQGKPEENCEPVPIRECTGTKLKRSQDINQLLLFISSF